ncbi:AhpD family alkylhydroperoxidase [Bradyrhizobium japonicum]|uniref:AhpD family alkylhydroperoxidase n=1 Tax=Bradyrhizobium elkanii TaxID=29448 RepID=A0ABV4F9Z8_BRAEL|nr:carboxymuconolactone decarboxylase family protein [Bradyrhizobium elkanii]MBP2432522.1 AhpD family alkylhydroperoxidase [Bradyrhizobium elkanii]MCP1734162.1 AhpD family alkylhydroperoxidase [Bradyrhizobium elkanii]MCP1751844.1 AhpD family alkylhydroperoxidase [Bradyrhizobium elkanii]MCP1977615.1 AhpD family alkylhydroperoxidase [Bradyrhizobium elkanii]MCS3569499.1 AhpD family alkylhydroperoxidase [Bradyrhizobium elkanii]
MTPRINLAAPNEGIEATRAADKWAQTKLEPKLIGLVKTRASQINGCTFCLHTHSGEAFKHGETPFPSAAFEGEIKGRITGKVRSGVEYLHLRADGRTDLDGS